MLNKRIRELRLTQGYSQVALTQCRSPQRAVLRYPLQDRPALVFFPGCWYNIGSGYLFHFEPVALMLCNI